MLSDHLVVVIMMAVDDWVPSVCQAHVKHFPCSL